MPTIRAFCIAALLLAAMPAARAETGGQQELRSAMSIVARPAAAYLVCDTADECRVGHDACNQPRALNKWHSDRYEYMADKVRATADCSKAPAAPAAEPATECVKNICILKTQ